jgi:hypothetical protein
MVRSVLFVAGAALLIALLWRLGLTDVLDAIGRVRWYFVAILALGAAHHATRARALQACVVRQRDVRYRDVLAIRLSGEAVQSLTFTGPVLAEPTKAWLLEKRGLTLVEGFAATITEYLIYTFVAAGMSIVGLVYVTTHFDAPSTFAHVTWTIVVLCVAFLVASAMAIARRFYLIGTIIGGLARAGLLRGRLTPDVCWINRMEDLLLLVLRDSPARFAGVAALELGAQALLVFELIVLLRALDVVSSAWSAFAIESSVKFFEFAFVFVPLQLGVSEGAYAWVFRVMSLPIAAGFAIAFLRRARGLVIASVGLATLAVMSSMAPEERAVRR